MRMILYIPGLIILLVAFCSAALLVGMPLAWVGLVGQVILGFGIIGFGIVADPSFSPTPATASHKHR